MIVLLIGQLPKEIGGSYTTGVANVVYELSQNSIEGFQYYTYGTNLKDCDAKKHSKYLHQYLGYKIRPLHIIFSFLAHPLRRISEWKHYKKVYKVNPIRFDIYRDNFVRVIKEVKPDVLNIHGTGIAPLVYANRSFGLPVVQTFHGVSDADDEEARRIRPQNIDSAKLADYVTVLTPRIRQFAIDTLHVQKDKVAVIPNGCDTKKFFFDSSERQNLRQKMEIKDTTCVFVTASSVIRRKGQLDFIKIVEKLSIDCQYWIIGKGPDYENCVSYCEKHNLGEKVKFLGYVPNPELYKYYSAADVFVHASYREAQALCEIEAYACGMKIILNEAIVGTVATDTNDNNTYFVLDFNNIDYKKLTQWSISKINRVSRTNRDWSVVVKEYKDFYKSLIK